MWRILRQTQALCQPLLIPQLIPIRLQKLPAGSGQKNPQQEPTVWRREWIRFMSDKTFPEYLQVGLEYSI